MKRLLIFITLFFLLVVSIPSVFAQKEMMLEEGLKNSKAMQAKPKGFGSVSKYQFGPYKIVSGKEGLTTTSGKSRFFSAQSESKSKKKLSFVFVRDDKDSVLANASVNTDLKDWNSDRLPVPILKGWSVLKESKENLMAIFSFPSDTTTWKMMIFSRGGEDVKGEGEFEGMLTDGKTEIQIKEIRLWNDGKKAMKGTATGYEFYSQGNSIAAVQSSLDTFQKKLVWIREDVDPKLQLILAAASAAMMVRTDSNLASMDRP